MPALTGDVTSSAGAVATTLATSGVTAGSYSVGNGSFTFDAKGRATAVTAPTNLQPIGGTLALGGFGSITGTLAVANGGTGATSYTNGQLLIGNTTGNTLAKGTIAGTANQVNVANGAGSITLSLPQSIDTGSSPTFAGLTLSGNGTLNGTHNTAPNQVGVIPAASDLTTADQVTLLAVSGYHDWGIGNYASAGAATVGGGTATSANSFGGYWSVSTSTTNPSSGIIGCENQPGSSGINSSSNGRAFDFTRKFKAVIQFSFNNENWSAQPNTVFRCTIGKIWGGSWTVGAPSAIKSIGFKVVFDTANYGHLFGEVCDGTTLTTSGSSIATLNSTTNAASGNLPVYNLVITSDGAGNVKFILGGTVIGTLTGAPTTAGANTSDTFTSEIKNTGDGTNGYGGAVWKFATQFDN
jgi:hypothetical protein